MERLTTISQAALIKCLDCIEESNCYSDISCEEIEKAFEKLRAYEDTGREPEEIQRWIPVEERLPDNPRDYWVTMRHLDGSVTTEKMFWSPDWSHEDEWREVVVAWQAYYCPEPYRPEN